MTSFISVTFEKDSLPSLGQVRIIVKARDDGAAPPLPSPIYFPTEPDTLYNFIVGEYIDDSQGERFVSVATLAEFSTVPFGSLDTFEDLTADFVVAGVIPGDVLRVTLTDASLWQSDEYPGSPFDFVVASVLGTQQLTVSPPFPAFKSGLVWEIVSSGYSGITGITRRNNDELSGAVAPSYPPGEVAVVGGPTIPVGGGGGPIQFRVGRFNTYYNDAATAGRFVTVTKAGLTSLANEASGAALLDESYTGEPA